MIIVEPNAELIAYTQLPPGAPKDDCSDMARVIERCGRVSWKSEDKMGPGTADGFMVRVVNIKKDESIAEHASATILLTTDRYASHQIVRHRIGAFTQESTHYINYGKEKFGEQIAVCRPLGIAIDTPEYRLWKDTCETCERTYLELIRGGMKHYHARFALSGALKTEIACTFNLRMWRHVLLQRTAPNNTPEIIAVMKMAGRIMAGLCPPMFEEFK